MGKITGFLEFDREDRRKQDPKERVEHYEEFNEPIEKEEIEEQAARCMDCGVPFCQSDYGCPLGNLIPDFNDSLYHKDAKKALTQLLSTNNFPEFTGRICPAPCESACVLGINRNPVNIKNIEEYLIENGFKKGWVTPKYAHQRLATKVAVIGSGPAGLAAAEQLNCVGHEVTVFERDQKAGGLLRYGIPDFKLDKKIVQRRIDLMEQGGVTFSLGCQVGKDITAEELTKEYDAIILATGCVVPRDLPIPGRELQGVYFAMEFLRRSNMRVSRQAIPEPDIVVESSHVVVIGGGDTGSDCIGVSVRQKAAKITQLEIMQRPPEGRDGTMPWPLYPRIFRISTSQEEANPDREYGVMTKEFIGDEQGHVRQIRCVKVSWSSGKLEEVPGSEFNIQADYVFLAMGFTGAQKQGIVEQLGLDIDGKGRIKTQLDNPHCSVGNEKVFIAGDARRGQSLVVWAISEGRECAVQVDQYLRKGESSLNQKSKSFYQHKSS